MSPLNGLNLAIPNGNDRALGSAPFIAQWPGEDKDERRLASRSSEAEVRKAIEGAGTPIGGRFDVRPPCATGQARSVACLTGMKALNEL